MRTLARRRETYVGEWLPEPLLTAPDVAEDVELAESVSIAMLTVLETLSPTERAVFVLHEVFAVPYDEIAEALDKTPRPSGRSPTARAGTWRPDARGSGSPEGARGGGRPAAGCDPDRRLRRPHERARPGRDRGRRWWRTRSGSPAPIQGAHGRKALLLVGPRASHASMWVNGALAITIEHDGKRLAVATVRVEGGRIIALYGVNNPDKLTRLDRETQLAT